MAQLITVVKPTSTQFSEPEGRQILTSFSTYWYVLHCIYMYPFKLKQCIYIIFYMYPFYSNTWTTQKKHLPGAVHQQGRGGWSRQPSDGWYGWGGPTCDDWDGQIPEGTECIDHGRDPEGCEGPHGWQEMAGSSWRQQTWNMYIVFQALACKVQRQVNWNGFGVGVLCFGSAPLYIHCGKLVLTTSLIRFGADCDAKHCLA